MTNLENLKKFAASTNNELFDADYKGGEWMVDAVETAETLEQFQDSSKTWSERTAMKNGEIAGFKFVAWKSAQIRKGQGRDSISVIDFGDSRVVLTGVDLTIY